MDRLTYDQHLNENQALREETFMLREMIKKLEAKIDDLQAKWGKNSKNSSLPLSSDQKSNLPSILKKEHRPYHAGASHQLLPEEAATSWRHLGHNECANEMRSEPGVAFAITPNQKKQTIRSLLG